MYGPRTPRVRTSRKTDARAAVVDPARCRARPPTGRATSSADRAFARAAIVASVSPRTSNGSVAASDCRPGGSPLDLIRRRADAIRNDPGARVDREPVLHGAARHSGHLLCCRFVAHQNTNTVRQCLWVIGRTEKPVLTVTDDLRRPALPWPIAGTPQLMVSRHRRAQTWTPGRKRAPPAIRDLTSSSDRMPASVTRFSAPRSAIRFGERRRERQAYREIPRSATPCPRRMLPKRIPSDSGASFPVADPGRHGSRAS